MEPADEMGREVLRCIAKGLSHIYDFIIIEFTIKVSTLNVNLMYFHAIACH